MSTGALEFTVVSATISRDAGFDFEPIDTYATIRCSREQRSTKTARDHGRLPAWNESFTFNLEEEDLSKDIIVQVFGVKSDLDELLGLARIPILTAVGKAEGTLCSLNCPGKGEVGQLKASWRWTPAAEGTFRDAKPQMESRGIQSPFTSSSGHSSSAFDLNVPFEAYDGPVSYPYLSPGSTKTGGENTPSDVADAMAKLALDKGYSGRSTPSAPPYVEADYSSRQELYSSECSYSSEGGAYPVQSYGTGPLSAYSPGEMNTASSFHANSIGGESHAYSSYPNVSIMTPGDRNAVGKEADIQTAAVYPPPGDSFEYNYPPLEQHETPAYVTRGSGKNKEKDKWHESHIPYNHPPPVHGGYPPPAPAGYPPGYPPAHHPGYPPAHPPPPPYGHPPRGYPPAAYPHVPVYSPAQHGYPPAPDHYAAPAYPPYGHPPPVYGSQHPIPDPSYPGHNLASTPYAHVGHSKHEKHQKNSKHDKHDKHDKYEKHEKKNKHSKK